MEVVDIAVDQPLATGSESIGNGGAVKKVNSCHQTQHEAEDPGMCNFLLKKKNFRRCKHPARPGTHFCGNHQFSSQNDVEGSPPNGCLSGDDGDDENRRTMLERCPFKSWGPKGEGKPNTRVKCPLDPQHDVEQANLKKHLKKCARAKQNTMKAQESYFRENTNMWDEAQPAGKSGSDVGVEDNNAVKEGEHRGWKQPPFVPLDSSEFHSLLKLLDSAAVSAIVSEPVLWEERRPQCDAYLQNLPNRSDIRTRRRHARQQASIASHLMRLGIVAGRKTPSRSEDVSSCIGPEEAKEPGLAALEEPLSKTVKSVDGDILEKESVVGAERSAAGKVDAGPGPPASIVVEFGCGRGYLAHLVWETCQVTHAVLIDRQNFKFKAERGLRRLYYPSNFPTFFLPENAARREVDAVHLQRLEQRALTKGIQGTASKQGMERDQFDGDIWQSGDGKRGRTKAELDVTIERLRIDIAHVEPTGIASMRHGERFAVIGKHLCGAATDMTLRCAARVLAQQRRFAGENSAGVSGAASAEAEVAKFAGLGVATCCHQLCSYDTFVNTQLMRELGIGDRFFTAISKMTSWYVCAMRPPQDVLDAEARAKKCGQDGSGEDGTDGAQQRGEEEEKEEAEDSEEDGEGSGGGGEGHGGGMISASAISSAANDLSVEERVKIGRRCKLLLECARLLYLRRCGMKAEFVSYVPWDVSPENTLLLAWL